MNPTTSFLGVSNGKFLGFIITSKGIHLDPDKIKAIQDMQPPKESQRTLRSSRQAGLHPKIYRKPVGSLSTIYTTNEEGRIFCLEWHLSKHFEDIKAYLTKPLVLASPVSGKPFLLCVRVMDHSLGALLAQKNDEVPSKPSIILAEP